MKLPLPRRNKNRRQLTPLERLRAFVSDRLSRRRDRQAVADAPTEAAREVAAMLAGAHAATPAPKRPLRVRMTLAVLGWTLTLGAALAAFVTPMLGVRAYQYVMQTGHFHVREVLIEGNRRLSYAAITDIAGIVPGTHVLAADLDEMARRLEAHAWIARANVTRELPDRLIVRLVEHAPVAYLAMDQLWLLDQSGVPFAPAGPEDDLDLPIITGVTAEELAAEPRASLARADLRSAINLTRLYASLGLATRWPIAEVRVETARRLTLVLSGIGSEAVLGTGPYRDKLYRLEWILESLHQQGKVAEYVLLDTQPGASWQRDDGRVVVKADLAPTDQELAERAAARARAAQEAIEAQGMGEAGDGAEGVGGSDNGSEAASGDGGDAGGRAADGGGN